MIKFLYHQIWPAGTPSVWLLYPFHASLLIFKYFLILCHKKLSSSYFPCSRPGISYFCKKSWFLLMGKWCLDIKEVCSLLLTFVSVDRTRRYVYIYYYINLSIFIYVYLYTF